MPPRPVTRADVQRLIDAGAQLIEALPAEEYDEEHLPGALHLPLKSLSRDRAARILEPGRPIVVYCWDGL